MTVLVEEEQLVIGPQRQGFVKAAFLPNDLTGSPTDRREPRRRVAPDRAVDEVTSAVQGPVRGAELGSEPELLYRQAIRSRFYRKQPSAAGIELAADPEMALVTACRWREVIAVAELDRMLPEGGTGSGVEGDDTLGLEVDVVIVAGESREGWLGRS